jgi:small subunit ribosomal protein S16
MAVKIRLRRMGAHKKPFYSIVVADSRSPRDGRFIEEIGYYNPLTDPADIKVNVEKAKKWISTGAKPTDTVRGLLKKAGAFDVPKQAEAEAAAVEVEEAAPAETAAIEVAETAPPEAETGESAETIADVG